MVILVRPQGLLGRVERSARYEPRRRHCHRVSAALGAIVAPFLLKPFGIFLISMWAVLTIAAIGLNLTLGYAGQVSMAQGAFVGIGAYTLALLTQAGVPISAGVYCRRGIVLRHRLAARLSGVARAASLSRFRHAGLLRHWCFFCFGTRNG